MQNKGKILGLDYGTKKIGVAISDEDRVIASSMENVYVADFDDALEKISEIAKDKNVNLIVLGLPLDIGYEPTKITNEVLEFKEKLIENTGLDVVSWNEIMTTKQAYENTREFKVKRKNLDSEAARIILQEFLDNQE